MSLYNMVAGYNPACIFLFPMLGTTQEDYSRFRDCYFNDGKIVIHTRLGGGNREDYQDVIDEIREHPNYLFDEDNNFDSTYADFYFSIPEKWMADFEYICSGKLSLVSDEYRAEVKKILQFKKHDTDDFFKEDIENPEAMLKLFGISSEEKMKSILDSLKAKVEG